MQKKLRKKVFSLLDNVIWIDCMNISPIKKKILVIIRESLNKQSQDFVYH